MTSSTTSLASYDSMKRLASQVVAYHVCDQSIIETCQVPEFIHSIAAQLSQSPFLTAYRVCTVLIGTSMLSGCMLILITVLINM